MWKALPFGELIATSATTSNGEQIDKEVVKQAARMKDQWRRRASLALVQENGWVINALVAKNAAHKRPRGRGLAAGWVEPVD